jgi:hypothetical protein
MIVGGGIDEVADDLLPRPSTRTRAGSTVGLADSLETPGSDLQQIAECSQNFLHIDSFLLDARHRRAVLNLREG